MTMNPLPPQAYTKETLGKAFAWLQAQSENLKEMATSPDILVSLYLKAKLNGNGALERPSIQNFKSELRSLAGMMGEFEVLDPSLSLEARVQSEMQTPQIKTEPPQKVAITPAVQIAAPQTEMQKPSISLPNLDQKSLTMIQEVKNELNLSSDIEALRVLISVGAKNLRKL